MKIPVFAAMLLSLACCAASAESAKRVAVLRFLDTSSWTLGDSRLSDGKDTDHIPRALAAMLSTDIFNLENIELIERESVNALYAETKLGSAELTSPETAQKIGGALNADLLVQGTFLRANGYLRVKMVLVKLPEGTRQKLTPIEGAENNLIDVERSLFEVLKKALAVPPRRAAPKVVAKSTAAGKKPTLAVLPLENTNPASAGADIGATVSDLIAQEIQNDSPRFSLVDREQVNKLLLEKKLVLSGMTSRSAVKDLGRMLGAQWILEGAYVRGAGQVRVDMRLIQPTSARVHAAFTTSGTEAEVRKQASRVAEYFTSLDLPEEKTPASPDVAQNIPEAQGATSKELEQQFAVAKTEFAAWMREAYFGMPTQLERWHLAYDEFTPKQKARGEDLIRQFKKFCFLQPNNPFFHFFLGNAYLELGQLEQAREELNASIRLGLDPVSPTRLIAQSLVKEKKYPAAINALQGLRTTSTSRAVIDYLISEYYKLNGDVEKKREYLERALKHEKKLAEIFFNDAMENDLRYEETSIDQRRIVDFAYFGALDCEPANFEYFCAFATHFTRESGEMDTYKQHSTGLAEKLKEITDRTGIKYIYFLTERMVYVKDPKRPEGFRWAPEQGRFGDIDYLDTYNAGPKDKYTQGRTVNEKGELIYKFTLGKRSKIMLSPYVRSTGDSLIEASPDKKTWTEISKEVYSVTLKLPNPNAPDARTKNQLDVTKYASPEGTIYIRFRDATPDSGASSSVFGMSLMTLP